MKLVETLRIGALDGPEEYTFGMIVGVAVGKDGRLYVADAQVPIVRMYDRDGRYLGDLGQKGAGPGEYKGIDGLQALPDGRVALLDIANGRITLYSASGEYRTTHRVQSGLVSDRIFAVDNAGRFYVRTAIRDPGQNSIDVRYGWIRIGTTGEIVDTVLIPPNPEAARAFVLATASGVEKPFTREVISALSPSGYLVVGNNSKYAVEFTDQTGRKIRLEKHYRPVPVTTVERGEWEAWAQFFNRQLASPRSKRPGVIDNRPTRLDVTIPKSKPAFSDLWIDADGRIWVRRYVAAQRRPGPQRPKGDLRPRRVWREPPTYDLLDPTGRFLGTIVLPWNAYPYHSSGMQIWATIAGEADEEYIARCDVSTPRR